MSLEDVRRSSSSCGPPVSCDDLRASATFSTLIEHTLLQCWLQVGGADGDESRDCEEIEFTLRHTCVSQATEDITTNDLIPDARFPDVLPISESQPQQPCEHSASDARQADNQPRHKQWFATIRMIAHLRAPGF